MSLATLVTQFKLTDAGTIKPRPRLIVVSQALEKQGKTHFALTAPGPLVHINFDRPLEADLLAKVAGTGKKIYSVDVKVPGRGDKIDQAECKKSWDSFNTLYTKVCEDPDVRTVVIDGSNVAYDLIRMAEFGRLEKVPPLRYGEVNAIMTQMYNKPAMRRGLNAIFIHRMKKQYQAKKNKSGEEIEVWNGNYERTGFSGAGFEVQVVIRHLRQNISGGGAQFGIRIEDSGVNGAELNGLELWDCDFPQLGMMAYPESEITDWY